LRTGKKSFAVLQAAAFFTPNGDGANDYWNLKGLNGSIYKNAKIFISIDGKPQTIKPLRVGWDGNYNGNSLPSDDYWYTIQLKDGRKAKGHFSLKDNFQSKK
jgi:gliding motility-associated-like protein